MHEFGNEPIKDFNGKKLLNPWDIMEHYLVKIAVSKRILEQNPQCKDCEHMQFWAFTPARHQRITMKQYCPNCPNFSGERNTDDEIRQKSEITSLECNATSTGAKKRVSSAKKKCID